MVNLTGTYMTFIQNMMKRVFISRIMNNKMLMIKSVGYQVYSMIATFLISFALTNNVQISTGISLLDVLSKSCLYFLYDTGWNNLMKRFQ